MSAATQLIRIDRAKGAFLLLPWAEYESGLLRAKAELRPLSNGRRNPTQHRGMRDDE